MTTITAETKRHVPTIPLALPSYAYPPMNSTYNYERAEGIYNKERPGTYKWETHFPERNSNLRYLGPDWFKQPPLQYALSPNYPKENYSPLPANNNSPLASKAYIPHLTNKAHHILKMRSELNLTDEYNNQTVTGPGYETSLGASYTQSPYPSLSSKYRDNDNFKHTSMVNNVNWKPYGNPKAYFNNYITGAPKFS